MTYDNYFLLLRLPKMLKSHDALPTLEPQNQAKSFKSNDALPTLKPQNHVIFTLSDAQAFYIF